MLDTHAAAELRLDNVEVGADALLGELHRGQAVLDRILDVAREKLGVRRVDVELKCADAEDALPWPSHHFDVVTLTGVLHHFFKPQAALKEAIRVLRPGGRLIMVDPCFFPPIREFFNLCLKVHPHAGDGVRVVVPQHRRSSSTWTVGVVLVPHVHLRGVAPSSGHSGAFGRMLRLAVLWRTQRTGSFVVQNRDAFPPPPDAPLSASLAGPAYTGAASPAIDSEECSVIEESP